MRNGLLALLGLLVGTGVGLAQPEPDGAPVAPRHAASPEPGFFDLRHWFGDWHEEPAHPSDRSWLTAEYLMWWVKDGPLPVPLVTTGPPTATIIGGLTQRGTRLLVGLTDQDYGAVNGLHLDGGLWLDRDRCLGVQAGYFRLEDRSTGIGVGSQGRGYPVLAQPLIAPATGQEFTEVIALPGFVAGGSVMNTHARFQGGELNAVTNYCSGDVVSVYLLAGFRVLALDEDVRLFTALVPLLDQFLTFQGQPIDTPSTLTTLDRFRAQNHFYGGQLGGRLDFNFCRVNVSLLGKLALGANEESVRIEGSSSLLTPAGTTTVPGGVLAVSSNIGRHRQDEFALVPEFALRISYLITDHLEAHFGYSFLFWAHVQRPGNAIDQTVESGLVPTDPLFGTATGTRPAFQFRPSLYSAQGLTFGLTLRF
jgi:hypothetical protein